MANYGAILILFLAAAALSGVLFTLATVIGPKSQNTRKARPFECGNNPLGPTVRKLSVKFYLVALLFIVFDLETVFLYPWAVVYTDLGMRGFWMMFTFVGVLGLGLVYVWRKGALDWE
ncbi:MAG: NADH-quinone oxidoreductase subunit A [Deltaproteobacteria bacterium]|nr:NADH-quinone oxidoreductase subunit A [Deltaproteobacteria bacterium]